MEIGISIYLGLGDTLADNLKLLEQAAALGYTQVFTSLHIPEADKGKLKQELQQLIDRAKALGMYVIMDVEPGAMESCLAEPTADHNIWRLDFGYSSQQMADLSRVQHIQLNASTITAAQLKELKEAGLNFANLSALHNFYPREDTGLGPVTLAYQNALLHSYGVPVGAFVPNQTNHRLPLRAGLPTLEAHRSRSVAEGAAELLALGVDWTLIGDPLPSLEELRALANIKAQPKLELLNSGQLQAYDLVYRNLTYAQARNQATEESAAEPRPRPVTLRVQTLTTNPLALELLQCSFTNRSDAAEVAIRAVESRGACKNFSIEPQAKAGIPRPRGSVTLDNNLYGRYKGELQVLLEDRPAEERTNIIARVIAEDLPLLDSIRSGTSFRFKLVGNS